MNLQLNHNPQSKWRSQQGFTLIEMMIVVALIAILASISAPSLHRMQIREISRGYADTLANQLKIAKTHARSQGQPLFVTITPGDPSNNTVSSILIEKGRAYCRGSSTTPGINGLCNDNMPPKPPVSCAELGALGPANREPFQTESLPGPAPAAISPDNRILATSINGNQIAQFCLSPDGRVLNTNGSLITNNVGLCSGEYLVILTAFIRQPNRTYAPGTSLDSLGFACPTPADAAEISAARDESNLYRVILPYNGAIRVTR